MSGDMHKQMEYLTQHVIKEVIRMRRAWRVQTQIDRYNQLLELSDGK